MQYCILTPNGFQMAGPEAALYNTQEEAMEHAAPGDNILPVVDSEKVVVYLDER